MIILFIDCLYLLNIQNNSIKIQEIIIKQINKISSEKEENLWIIGFIGIHFSTICIEKLLEIFFNKISIEKIQNLNPITIKQEEIEKMAQTLEINNIIELLEFLSEKSIFIFENKLLKYLENRKIENLSKVLFFLPKTLTLCCRKIILFIKNQILIEKEKENLLKSNFISFLFLRLVCFQSQILQFLKCLFEFSEENLIKFNEFLSFSFENLNNNQNHLQNHQNHSIDSSKELICDENNKFINFYKHIYHLRCCIIFLCKNIIQTEASPSNSISLSYLQMICIFTDESSALDVLFHIFMNKSLNNQLKINNFLIFIQLLDLSNGYYNQIKKKFIDRLISYFPYCNSIDLPHVLENLIFLSKYELENKIKKENSLIQFLANEIHFELLFSFFNNSDSIVRILSFKLLNFGVLIWFNDPIVNFLLIQKLFSSLFYYMNIRYSFINSLHLDSIHDHSNFNLENIIWMITHISSLSKYFSFLIFLISY